MHDKIVRVINLIRNLQFRFLVNGSIVIVEPGSHILIGKNVLIKRSKIVVKDNYSLTVGDNSLIKNSTLAFYSQNGHKDSHIGSNYLFNKVQVQVYGSLKCGNWNIFEQHDNKPMMTNFNGQMIIDHHNRFTNRFWIRFNATVKIGSYNNINEDSWLRADESITIGNYNQISYNVMIWDTNTHNIYKPEKRRYLTEHYYPFFGYEEEKPITKPIIIGSDCWIAQNVTILKGTIIGDCSIVGFGTLLTQKEIPSSSKVINKQDINIL
ncbi:acyltransferase [Phocaeicola sp.]